MATGDRGGRLVLFERKDRKDVKFDNAITVQLYFNFYAYHSRVVHFIQMKSGSLDFVPWFRSIPLYAIFKGIILLRCCFYWSFMFVMLITKIPLILFLLQNYL